MEVEIKLHGYIRERRGKIFISSLTATVTCTVDTLTTLSKQEVSNISHLKMVINKDLLGFKVLQSDFLFFD